MGIQTFLLKPFIHRCQPNLNASILTLSRRTPLNPSPLQLRHKPIHIPRSTRRNSFLLLHKSSLDFIDQRGHVNEHALLLGVSFFETHFFDAELAGGELVFAENDAEGDAALFGGFELLGEFGLDFVGEFGLFC